MAGDSGTDTLIIASGKELLRLRFNLAASALFAPPNQVMLLDPTDMLEGQLTAGGTIRALHCSGEYIFFVSDVSICASPAHPGAPPVSNANASFSTRPWRRMQRLSSTSTVFDVESGIPLSSVTSIAGVLRAAATSCAVEDYALFVAAGGRIVLVEAAAGPSPSTSLAHAVLATKATHALFHLSGRHHVHNLSFDATSSFLYFTDALNGSVFRFHVDIEAVLAGRTSPTAQVDAVGAADVSGAYSFSGASDIDPSASFFSPDRFGSGRCVSPPLDASPAPHGVHALDDVCVLDNGRVLLALAQSGTILDLCAHPVTKQVAVHVPVSQVSACSHDEVELVSSFTTIPLDETKVTDSSLAVSASDVSVDQGI